MKYIMCSRVFPKGHPKAGQPTFFPEKIFACLPRITPGPDVIPGFDYEQYENCKYPKGHTIRGGFRFKAGDKVSLRVWSGLPYRSKQIDFARVTVCKTWKIEIAARQSKHGIDYVAHIDDHPLVGRQGEQLAHNDGLTNYEFVTWFVPPKTKFDPDRTVIFSGQIICWDDRIEYNQPMAKKEEVQS